MADTDTKTKVEDKTTEVDDKSDDGQGPKGLREAKDRAETKANVYHAQAMALAFDKVGIDVTEGIGNLLLGAYEGEPDPTAIESFALENGWMKEGTPDPKDQAAKIGQTDQKLKTATAQSTSDDRDELDERLKEAAENGKWREYTRLQQGKYAEIARRKFDL